ncbi:hypothetical protein AB8850_17655 [Streptomyces griseorubens]
MHGRRHDVLWGTVRVVLAVVLLGVAWQAARAAERARSADLDFPRLAVHDAQGRDTGGLKVCGDRYPEPFCLRAEHVTVDEVLLKLRKKSSARYRFEFGRSGGRTLALKLDVGYADRDLVEAVGRRGKATLYWWRDSVRLLEVSAGGERRMLRTAHYPGREFVFPAASGSVLAGLGAAFLWSGLWRLVRGGVSRLNWPWQTTVPGVAFTLAGLGGACSAVFAAHSPWAMAWTAGVVGVVSAVGAACWAYRTARRRKLVLERMSPSRRWPNAASGAPCAVRALGQPCRWGFCGPVRRGLPSPPDRSRTPAASEYGLSPGLCAWSGCGHRTGTTRCGCVSCATGGRTGRRTRR